MTYTEARDEAARLRVASNSSDYVAVRPDWMSDEWGVAERCVGGWRLDFKVDVHMRCVDAGRFVDYVAVVDERGHRPGLG